MKSGRSGDGSARAELRLVPPLDDHAPSSLNLGVGDLVVYASHGIGRVESTQPSRGDLPETVVLVFEGGLRVTLPLARACQALRALSRPEDLEDVRRTLSADVPPTMEPWSRRNRTIRETVAAGTITGLAEIVRDGMQRERRLAAGIGGRSAAPSERALYLQARRLLAAEIAACCGIEAEAADAWIVQQSSGEAVQS
jgi:RNA polymerase-interacting CarD/CdnL/TRCF family regulator